MGIDVEIVAKVKGEPDGAQIARWSWELCESIGARHFWLDAKETPPRRALDLTEVRYREDGDPPPGKRHREDAAAHFYAGEGEYLLRVSTMGRYYGVDYERGDILVYCAIAEWIEQNIANAEVYYGGDSSGVTLERFDEAKRKSLRAHLYSRQGRDYYVHDTEHIPPTCAICIPGRPRFSQFGFGVNYCAVHCAGCGKSWTTRDRGKTWAEEKEER